MARGEDEHRIENEPHLRPKPGELDPSEKEAEFVLFGESEKRDAEEELAQHSVFDEPAYLASSKPPPGAPGYESWFRHRKAAADPRRAWRIAVLSMLAGGPWAILGALISGGGGVFAMVVSGPVTEEVMKVAILATLLEVRPFTFTRRAQIHLAAVGAGLGFAIIENLVYLNVYIEDPSATITLWRWTVCVALHTGCSLVASLGVARMWMRSMESCRRPRMGDMLPAVVLAIAIHGAYNGTMLLLSLSGFDF